MNLIPSRNVDNNWTHKTGSEPASKENVVHQSYNLPGLTKNITVHSNGSHDKSSNYILMKNITNPPSDSFYTIKPSVSQQSHPTIPLQIQSDVIKQHVDMPLSFGQNLNKSLVKSQFKMQDPVIMEEDHNYKFQYIEMRNSFYQLKETYDRLTIDYDILTQKIKLSQNNEQFLVRNNQDLLKENTSLKNDIFELNQQLSTTRMHKQSLQNQIQQLQKIQSTNFSFPNLKIIQPQNTPSNQTQPKNAFELNLTHIEHENCQLLYRIQEYESTILYKNLEIQKLKAEIQNLNTEIVKPRAQIQKSKIQIQISKEEIDKLNVQNQKWRTEIQARQIEIMRLKKEIEALMKKQNQFIKSEREKILYQKQASIVPSLRAQIQKLIQQTSSLKRQNQKLNILSDKLKQQLQSQTTQNHPPNVGSHQYNRPPDEMNIIQSFSKVLKTYIGENQGKTQNQNQSFSKINKTLYNNLNQVMTQEPFPTRDQRFLQQKSTSQSLEKKIYEGARSIFAGNKQKMKMKIQNEAFFDFSNEFDEINEQKNRQRPQYQPKIEEIQSFDYMNQNKMRILDQTNHSEVSHKNQGFYGVQLLKQRISDDILSFPQLPFRGSKVAPYNDANKNPISVPTNRNKVSYQGFSKTKLPGHHCKIFSDPNCFLKGHHNLKPNEVVNIGSFQQKLFQLAQQNQQLKYSLLQQQHTNL